MSKRTDLIVKNTAFLYMRMLVTMLVGLYTSRVLLQILGAEDFGLYHVVAGFVLLAGFFQGSLSGSTQRFIAFELGKKEKANLKNVFSTSINVHILFGVIILLIGGVFGSYLLPKILKFDVSRTVAVNFVFWTALLSFIINTIVVPYHAVIIAHEEMKVFAWISLIDAFLKLGIVFLIGIQPYDSLIAYGVLMLGTTLSVGLVYVVYVYLRFKEVRYERSWDNALFKKQLSFSGWTIWGNAASVFANQGTDILLNIFFGPTVNAAKSIGNQASSAVNRFVTNLQMAINPQIIKSYSANDHKYTTKLINYASKYNFFLIFLFALPLLLRTEDVLKVWLIDPPEYAEVFLKLILINMIIESVSRPLITAAQATGNIKLYQLVVGGILLLNLPMSYLLLKQGFGPEIVFIVAIFVTLTAATARIFMLKRIFKFSFVSYFYTVMPRVVPVSALSIASMYYLSLHLPASNNLVGLSLFTLVSMLITVIFTCLVGLEKFERKKVLDVFTILKGKFN